jgi:hypothetical protein
MKLYHGTARAALDLILKRGIEPRGRKKRGTHWEKDAPQSCPHAVYLTDTYPLYFAAVASLNATRHRNIGLVVEIDHDLLAEDWFNADEDALEQIGRRKDGLPAHYTPTQRVEHYRDLLTEKQWSYQDSLRALGTCCYLGTITPGTISRIAIIDFQKQPYLRLWALDAQIILGNYRFCAHDYHKMTAWVFGDPEPEASDFAAGLAKARAQLEKESGIERKLAYEEEGRAGITILTEPF